jgi:transcription initiation factor TFIID subunit TAF12
MATCTMIAEMKMMMTIFSVNMSSRFKEKNTNFMKLNARLANIERQHSPRTCEARANICTDRFVFKVSLG